MMQFFGKLWSSQSTIKQEAPESDASEQREKGSDVDMPDADADILDGNVDTEDMIRIAQREQEMLEQNENESPKAGKKGKRARKGRKSKDSIESRENEGEQLEGEGDDEEVPQLVEAMDTSGANLDVQEHAEKPKRKGRNSGSTAKRKRKSTEKDAPFLLENVVPNEEENSVMAGNKSASKRSRNTRSRKSDTKLVEEDTDEDEPAQLKDMNHSPQVQEGEGEEPISADLADLPKKLRRAKKNAGTSSRRTVQVVIESAVVDEDDVAATLHKPLTPAHVEHHRTHSGASAEAEKEAEITPKKPSKKALGKRKASDIGVTASTSKKRKTQSDKAAGTPALASFGFIHSSDFERRPTPMFTPINGPRASILPPSAQPPRPPVDPLADGDSDEDIFIPEASISRSNERKKKRRLPIGDDLPNPQTPLNKGSRNSKTPKSAAKTPQAKTPATGRSGKLSNEQVTAIVAAVEEFREEKGFSQVDINDMIQKSARADTVGLWKHIFEEVSDVPHRSTQQFCRRRFHNFEARGQWTEEQDQELRDAYEKYPAKWKQIGETLNRFSEDCRDRWRNYAVCGDNLGKGAWVKEEEERLKEVVEECIKSIREMKRVSTDAADKAKSDESLIDWNVVSQNMDYTRSRLQCIQKWKVMKEREEVVINDPVLAKPISETWRAVESLHVARKMTAKEKLLLLYAVRESAAGREGKIPWRRVKEDVPGKLKKMTMKIAFRQMRQHIEGNADMALQDIVDHLVDAYEASVPSEPTGFDDDFERFQSSQKILSNKKKRKRRSNVAAEAQVDSSSDDNGEGPSTITKPKRKPRLSEKFVVEKENEPDDIYAIPRDEPSKKSKSRKTTSSLPAQETPVSSSASKSKRKLRERMKSIGQSQSQSQETDEQRHSEVSDVHIALESLKTGNSRARRAAAKEAAKSKGKKLLSEERVVESGDAQPQDEQPSNKKPPKAKRKRVLGKPFPSEERVVESDDEERAAEVPPKADKTKPLVNGNASLSDEPVVESDEEEAPVSQELLPADVDMNVDDEVSVDREEPDVHEDEPSVVEEPIENAEVQPASEEEPEVNDELSQNEADFSDSQNLEVEEDEIDMDKHHTALAAGVVEIDEAETALDEETPSQDEDLANQKILPDEKEPSVDESENEEFLAYRNTEANEDDLSVHESENEEELPATQDLEADEDAMDMDNYETIYTAPGGPEAEDDDSLVEDEEDSVVHQDQESVDLDKYQDEEEEDSTRHHDQESVDLDAVRDTSANEDIELDGENPPIAEEEVPPTNGFHEEERSQNYGSDADTDFHGFQTEAGSMDLDTPVKTTQGTQSSSPAASGRDTPKVNGFLNSLTNEYANGYKYHEEEVSSDDDDMSDIPAKIVPKAKVVETKKEKKPKKDKKSKHKSKKRVSGFK